jgi:hypothetical protein
MRRRLEKNSNTYICKTSTPVRTWDDELSAWRGDYELPVRNGMERKGSAEQGRAAKREEKRQARMRNGPKMDTDPEKAEEFEYLLIGRTSGA